MQNLQSVFPVYEIFIFFLSLSVTTEKLLFNNQLLSFRFYTDNSRISKVRKLNRIYKNRVNLIRKFECVSESDIINTTCNLYERSEHNVITDEHQDIK